MNSVDISVVANQCSDTYRAKVQELLEPYCSENGVNAVDVLDGLQNKIPDTVISSILFDARKGTYDYSLIPENVIDMYHYSALKMVVNTLLPLGLQYFIRYTAPGEDKIAYPIPRLEQRISEVVVDLKNMDTFDLLVCSGGPALICEACDLYESLSNRSKYPSLCYAIPCVRVIHLTNITGSIVLKNEMMQLLETITHNTNYPISSAEKAWNNTWEGLRIAIDAMT